MMLIIDSGAHRTPSVRVDSPYARSSVSHEGSISSSSAVSVPHSYPGSYVESSVYVYEDESVAQNWVNNFGGVLGYPDVPPPVEAVGTPNLPRVDPAGITSTSASQFLMPFHSHAAPYAPMALPASAGSSQISVPHNLPYNLAYGSAPNLVGSQHSSLSNSTLAPITIISIPEPTDSAGKRVMFAQWKAVTIFGSNLYSRNIICDGPHMFKEVRVFDGNDPTLLAAFYAAEKAVIVSGKFMGRDRYIVSRLPKIFATVNATYTAMEKLLDDNLEKYFPGLIVGPHYRRGTDEWKIARRRAAVDIQATSAGFLHHVSTVRLLNSSVINFIH